MKECNKCHILKVESDFNLCSYKDKTYLYNECKVCMNQRTKENYYKNHSRQKEIRKRNTNNRRVQHKEKILQYLLTHNCTDCAESDPIVLEFDHVHGKKSFNISAGLMKNWEVIEEEINKCEVVCANCHKKRTANRSGNWFKDLKRNK